MSHMGIRWKITKFRHQMSPNFALIGQAAIGHSRLVKKCEMANLCPTRLTSPTCLTTKPTSTWNPHLSTFNLPPEFQLTLTLPVTYGNSR